MRRGCAGLLLAVALVAVGCKKQSRRPGASERPRPTTEGVTRHGPWDDVVDGKSALRLLPAGTKSLMGGAVRARSTSPVVIKLVKDMQADVEIGRLFTECRLDPLTRVDWVMMAETGPAGSLVVMRGPPGDLDGASVTECAGRVLGLQREPGLPVWTSADGHAIAAPGGGLLIAGGREWVLELMRDPEAAARKSAAVGLDGGVTTTLGLRELLGRVDQKRGFWLVMLDQPTMSARGVWGAIALEPARLDGEMNIEFAEESMAKTIGDMLPSLVKSPEMMAMFSSIDGTRNGPTVTMTFRSEGAQLSKLTSEVKLPRLR